MSRGTPGRLQSSQRDGELFALAVVGALIGATCTIRRGLHRSRMEDVVEAAALQQAGKDGQRPPDR